ncbi:MAG: phenylalanine--tRNA ligase subunit alpha [Clostridiales bacterium]|jgi:phenylalanyl-tRNA synthetase alpha chain|nr:phenylalanine--tRNA ligase subunit alpha [Clostridiales bacterium]
MKPEGIKPIEEILQSGIERIADAKTEEELNRLRVAILGKSGSMTALLRELKNVSNGERPVIGRFLNEARETLETAFSARERALKAALLNERLKNERIDITIDRETRRVGGQHPLYLIKNKVTDFFSARGFMIADSPEIEFEYYNFDALNMPGDHPARDTQDTFYITDRILLRTHTSPGQIRTMEKKKPPIRMITVGKVYRSDDIDATHSPMFHQIEGLVVDKGVTMCDLKGILSEFAASFFGQGTVIRFRPSHFPFTEPSVEVDATCPSCGGSGCRVCKGTGWIEILGAGMVNRRVLENCEIDPNVYTGFAFGIGLDRITLITHGISDLRLVYENDIRFLKQFS